MEILVTKKVIVKFLYLTILFITASMPVFSQTINVLHNITGDPIENVAIYNQTRDVSTLTDSKGIADLSIFGAGDTLSFQHPAFTIKTRTMPELAGRENIYLSRKVILMDEFVISASKALENKKQVPYKIDVIDDEKIHEITSQTAAEMLESTGNVFLQKSQGGGGSPILRGFEANKVLLVIDGVRMNNAIYRGGHLQNAITIDNNILQRAEIVYGPSSVIYGSDALGGVIHYYTRNPKLSLDETPDISGNVYGQFSTVNNGKIGNVNLNVGLKNFASLTSFTSSDYGDIKMGTNRNPFLNDFGKLNHHAIRHNGQDSTVRNEDPNIQKNTGYTQYDFLQKLLYRVNSKLDLNLNIQYSTSSNVDRFDKLNDYQDEHTMKYAT
ncbi:MAG: TonB-dependent receptor plug domain-containing protein, partial [Bacteroidota bacterium]